MIRFASNANSQLGRDAVVRASEQLGQDLRETAFAFACDMILADGIVGSAEREFLNDIASILRVPDEVGDAILQTTIIRNRNG